MLVTGLFKIGNPGGIAGDLSATGSYFQLLFQYVMSPLNSTMYALLAFYVASASYRAFRAKNTEATILLVAAFVILLGRTALGVSADELDSGAAFGAANSQSRYLDHECSQSCRTARDYDRHLPRRDFDVATSAVGNRTQLSGRG